MVVYLIVFVILFLLERVYLRIAESYGIVDKPNERSSHNRVTLRGGGIVFYFGMLVYFLLYGFEYKWFMLGLTLAAIISFIDDVKPVSPKIRMAVQLIALFLIFYQWGIYNWYPLWVTISALIVCAGVLNAFNFMDGINGITGGYAVICLGTLLFLDVNVIHFMMVDFLVLALISVLVFLFFNFRVKARCFAGDVGSVSIAMIIIFALGQLMVRTSELGYIVFLAVYGVDSVCTIVHRLILKENIFKPHRGHLYQIMANEMKIKNVVVASIYMIVQLLINVGYILIPDYKWIYVCGVFILLGSVYIIMMSRYFKLHKNVLCDKNKN